METFKKEQKEQIKKIKNKKEEESKIQSCEKGMA
jgi:hypothetical protein